MNENLKPIEKLTPFTRMIMTIGTLPSSFYASMSYYESMVWLYEYLKNTVIPTVNNNAEAVEELQTAFTTLQNWIEHYFDNLDLQQEVNTKLDEMAEDGSLTNLIKAYVDPIYQAYENEMNLAFSGLSTTTSNRLLAQDLDIANFKGTVNSQIATINDKVESASSGSPKGVYATVAALTSADPSHDYTYVVSEDGKWYYYNTSTTSWTAGGTYQATVNPEEVKLLQYSTKEINKLLEDAFLNVTWEHKAIWVTPSTMEINIAPNATRDAFVTPISFPYDLYIKVNPNYRLAIIMCNEAGTTATKVIEFDYFNQNRLAIIPKNTFFIMALKRSDDANIDLNEIKYIYSLELVEIENHLNDKNNEIYNGNTIDYNRFEHIDAYLSQGNIIYNLYGNSTKRLVLRYQINNKPIKLKAKSGYKIGVTYTDETATYGYLDTGWKHEIIIVPNKYYMLRLAKEDETQTIPYEDRYNVFIDTNDYENNVINSVGHRGIADMAPENTLISYKLAKAFGFKYGECDVQFTSDNVAVLLHDRSINRTARDANGDPPADTLNIDEITYSTASSYDYGLWFSEIFENTPIPTFDEYIKLCRNINLHPYIEIKNDVTYTDEQLASLVNTVKKYDMLDNVTWISFSDAFLFKINTLYNKSRLGLVTWGAGSYEITQATALKAVNYGEVFLDEKYELISTDLISSLKENNISLEGWTFDTESSITSANAYVTGFTSNKLVASEILKDNA